MSTATLNIELSDASEYLSILGKTEQHKGSTTHIEKIKNGVMVTVLAEDSKTLLSSIGSTIRKLKIINAVSDITPSLAKKIR